MRFERRDGEKGRAMGGFGGFSRDVARAPAESAGGADAAAPQAGFFRTLEALSPDRHATLGFKRVENNYAFARETRLAPITVGEFAQAALSYPIVFAGDRKLPCAVMGLKDGENFFIGADGALPQDAYVPGIFRQYPFMLSHIPGVREPVLMLDRSSDSFVENGGAPLLENGAPAEVVKDALSFLRGMQVQWSLTERFVQAINARGLIEATTLKFATRDDGGALQAPQDVAEYFTITMSKLKSLTADEHELYYENDYFSFIYAQALSLQNWPRVIERALSRAAGA